jgi:hypothetical protein
MNLTGNVGLCVDQLTASIKRNTFGGLGAPLDKERHTDELTLLPSGDNFGRSVHTIITDEQDLLPKDNRLAFGLCRPIRIDA